MLPQITLLRPGLQGAIYQTHAVATDDFIRLGKEKVEGTILAAGPMLVIDEIRRYESDEEGRAALISRVREAVREQPATFGANTCDAGLLLQRAIPVAL